jgi:regulator of sirC expression with transglutaminase-like and TPR domain
MADECTCSVVSVDMTERFTELVNRPETEIPLDETALVIAGHAHPDLDVDHRLRELDALAATVPTASGKDAPARLAHHLFVELGFAGNRDDYTDPENSYLDAVLDRRLGIPITLSVLMLEVGRRIDVPLRGVGMPGHFLVGGGAGEWFDPFNGGERLDLNGCAQRFAETQNAAAFRPQHLRPVGPLRIIERMLANLQHTTMRDKAPDAVWVTRLRLRIPDISLSLRGQLAGVLGNYGHFGEAARELDVLARQLPGDGGKQAAEAATRFRARTN